MWRTAEEWTRRKMPTPSPHVAACAVQGPAPPLRVLHGDSPAQMNAPHTRQMAEESGTDLHWLQRRRTDLAYRVSNRAGSGCNATVDARTRPIIGRGPSAVESRSRSRSVMPGDGGRTAALKTVPRYVLASALDVMPAINSSTTSRASSVSAGARQMRGTCV